MTRINEGRARVGIIGLGYVGLPLAIEFSKRFEVWAYDSNTEKRESLRAKKSYVDDVSDSAVRSAIDKGMRVLDRWKNLSDCDCIVICVPTPLTQGQKPDLSYVEQSADIVRRVVKPGMLIVLESTSYPGTTREFLGSAILAAGLRPGEEVGLAFSPERVDPGNKTYSLSNTPKIVGGADATSTELAVALYSMIVKADVVRVRDCETAEAAKILENIFRGVNIALINEMALIFSEMGIDTWEVVRAAATKPFAYLPHYPGPGVGGHCIPLDPVYLSYKARQVGIIPRFIELSREVNEFMKFHTVNLTVSALEEAGIDSTDAVIGVLGLSYKERSSDTRESPAADIIEELGRRRLRVVAHDPLAKHISVGSETLKSRTLKEVFEASNCLLFLVSHPEFRRIDMDRISSSGVRAIVDTRNIFGRDEVESRGLVYRGIGK